MRSASASAARVAATPASSGIGWAASQMVMRGMSPSLWPYLVMTRPSRRFSPSAFAAAFAMRQAAFPMAITVTGRSKRRPSSAR